MKATGADRPDTRAVVLIKVDRIRSICNFFGVTRTALAKVIIAPGENFTSPRHDQSVRFATRDCLEFVVEQ